MKKLLLVLAVVLAITPVASAISASYVVDAADQKDHYLPSDIITINVVADFAVGSFAITNITATAGTAEAVGTVNAAFTVTPKAGTLINDGGVLINDVGGGILTFMFDPLAAGEVIYTFEFHVPQVDASTNITISDSGYTSFLYGNDEVTDMTDLSIHVGGVPEPMTIALLGLGGLFLRRRK